MLSKEFPSLIAAYPEPGFAGRIDPDRSPGEEPIAARVPQDQSAALNVKGVYEYVEKVKGRKDAAGALLRSGDDLPYCQVGAELRLTGRLLEKVEGFFFSVSEATDWSGSAFRRLSSAARWSRLWRLCSS
jgi:hypothetical protein